ncbi:MAG: hypothetical protein WC856_26250 [Methylococcaceae bacterium]|jgi:hypothetical protein
MDTPNPELLALPKSTQSSPSRQTRQKLPRHHPGEKFLKGPIPLIWLSRAAQLPGKSLQVALAIWFLAGLKNHASVKLGQSVLNDFGVNRHSKARALKQLASAKLISIQSAPGCAPVITVLAIMEAEA